MQEVAARVLRELAPEAQVEEMVGDASSSNGSETAGLAERPMHGSSNGHQAAVPVVQVQLVKTGMVRTALLKCWMITCTTRLSSSLT